MVKKYVKSHERLYPVKRNGKRKPGKVKVGGFRKQFKSVGKKREISAKGVMLYPIVDEYGHRLGWSTKPPKKASMKSFGSFRVVNPSGKTDKINGRPAIFDYAKQAENHIDRNRGGSKYFRIKKC